MKYTKQTVELLISACASAVNQTPFLCDPDTIKEQLPALFSLADSQSVAALVAQALAVQPEDEAYRPFAEARDKAIRKAILMGAERQKLTAFLNQAGIWFLPLKGIILETMYPAIGMREMGDNDFLFDENGAAQIKTYFEQNGYRTVSFGKGKHDSYEKPPVFLFEMHRTAVTEEFRKHLYQYFSKIEEHLLPGQDGAFSRSLSDEDFYIFMMAHAYRHDELGGIGIRPLLDCYVFLKQKQNSLDFAYIENELNLAGIAEWEKEAKALSLSLFSKKQSPLNDLTSAQTERLKSMIKAGTYGTRTKMAENEILRSSAASGSKCRLGIGITYCIKRMFPSPSYMRAAFPFCRKHPLTLPFFYLYRLICRGAGGTRRNLKEAKRIAETLNNSQDKEKQQ